MRRLKIAEIIAAALVPALVVCLCTSCQPKQITLSAPAGLTAGAEGCHSLKICWDEVEGADGYSLTLDAFSDAENEDKAASSSDKPEFAPMVKKVSSPEALLEKLPADTEFKITVVPMKKDAGKAEVVAESASVNAKTGCPEISPAAGLRAEEVSSSSVKLCWEAASCSEGSADGSTGKISYTVCSSAAKDGQFYPIAENLEKTEYTVSRLDEDSTYYYKINAVVRVDNKEFGCEPSDIAEVTTLKEKPPEPEIPEEVPAEQTEPPDETEYEENYEDAPYEETNWEDDKRAQAFAVAQKIADSVTGETDLERVAYAAAMVGVYCSNAYYSTEGDDYYTAYGVFIKGECSCAGTTRALGMVLDCMGYEWEHVNENQWTHQWCALTMDGQKGWADGQVGLAGYGKHPILQ